MIAKILFLAADANDVRSVQNFSRELAAFMRLRYSALLLLSALTADDERLRTVILMSTEDQGTSQKFFFVNTYFIGSPIVQPPWVITRLTEALSEQQDPNDHNARYYFMKIV